MVCRNLLLAVALLVTGCGREAGRIVGRVTYKGAPLTSGSVMIHAADGNQYGASLAPDGNYRVDGVPPGPARVTVHSQPPKPPGLLGKDLYRPAGREASHFTPIPVRYTRADESGIACVVKAGEQRCDMDLTQ
jgi:hypothetical protein